MIYVVMGDFHHPYLDKKAFHAALDVVCTFDDPHVVLLGDFLDCTSFSKYPKGLAERSSWKTEVREATKCLDDIGILTSNIHFLHGNHEARFDTYITKQAPELEGGVPPISEVLGFEDRGIIDHGQAWYIPTLDLTFTHGSLVRKHSAYSAKAMQEKTGGSLMMGHTHRLGAFFYTDWNGTRRAYENGCLCRMDLPWLKDKPNWQQGFSVVYAEGTRFDVAQYFIQKGKVYDPSGGRWQ